MSTVLMSSLTFVSSSSETLTLLILAQRVSSFSDLIGETDPAKKPSKTLALGVGGATLLIE